MLSGISFATGICFAFAIVSTNTLMKSISAAICFALITANVSYESWKDVVLGGAQRTNETAGIPLSAIGVESLE